MKLTSIIAFVCIYLAAVDLLYGTKAVYPFPDKKVDALASLMDEDLRISAMNTK